MENEKLLMDEPGNTIHSKDNSAVTFYVIDGNAGNQNIREIAASKSKGYLATKRTFDVVSSALGLVILSPLFLGVAIAIRLEDGGPVIYVQERSGKDNKPFRMYKFRTMCKDAEKLHESLLSQNELDGPAFKMKNDPRITKVGHFLRKTSIDELPQLLNILKGEMSVVGPRPLPTYETAKCTEYQKQRLAVTPGLTCYWQCSGRNDIEFDEWMELDFKYIREQSIGTDLKILLKTVKSVLGGAGAY